MNRVGKLGLGVICVFIFGLLAFGGLLGGIYVDTHVYVGKTEHMSSPDGKVVAYVRLDNMTAGPDEYGVRLRKWYSPFRRSVFSAQTYGAKLQVRWIDNSHLAISCERCEDLTPAEARTELNGISVAYSLNVFR